MRIENGYYLWNKGEYLQLTPHFVSGEFECPCKYPECKEQRISVELVQGLEDTRFELGLGMTIAEGGGFRCGPHQRDIAQAGAETVAAGSVSQHELGNAADPWSHDNARMREILAKHFMAMGIGRNKTHVDTRTGRVRRWTYSG